MTRNEDDDPRDSKKTKARKERVLHTRVPAVLEQELKRLAESLRVPVSNVVRTILEDAVTTIDTVGKAAEGELRDVANRLGRRRDELLQKPPPPASDPGQASEPESAQALEEPAPAPLAGIVGYQPLLLVREERCRLCGRAIAAGERAYLGIRDTAGGPRVIVDEPCLPFSAAEPQPTTDKEQSDD